MVALYLSVCPSVCGWYVVDGFPCICNRVYSASMNDEMNCGPRSEITFWGVPWSLNIWSRNIVATPFAVISVEMGNNRIIFKKRSTMVRITFFPCDSGKGPMMSTNMISQGHCGTVFGCNGVLAALVTDLVF